MSTVVGAAFVLVVVALLVFVVLIEWKPPRRWW